MVDVLVLPLSLFVLSMTALMSSFRLAVVMALAASGGFVGSGGVAVVVGGCSSAAAA